MNRTAADEAIQLLTERGSAAYFGEHVSQLEHALQAAHAASLACASPALIAAALLHDVGHLLHHLPEDIGSEGTDTRHEIAGSEWLLARFGPAVAEPARAHVAAKRYLCSTEPEYVAGLSPASLESLALQGGPFLISEIRDFEALPWFREAVQLRRWDDAAKIPGMPVPHLESYRALLESL